MIPNPQRQLRHWLKAPSPCAHIAFWPIALESVDPRALLVLRVRPELLALLDQQALLEPLQHGPCWSDGATGATGATAASGVRHHRPRIDLDLCNVRVLTIGSGLPQTAISSDVLQFTPTASAVVDDDLLEHGTERAR
jgi:hypothetical protein